MREDLNKLFLAVGMTTTESKVLTFLFLHNNGESRNIEREMDMRQPEVSSSLSIFLQKGWVNRKKMPHSGKGRPNILFTLKKSKKEIIDEMINACNAEIEELLKTKNELEKFKETKYVTN